MAELDTFDTTEATGDSDDPSGIIVVNELLCFMQEKGDIMTADDIVKICCDFYSREDIEKARTTWHGGLVVGRRTCDLVVAGSRPGRDAAA